MMTSDYARTTAVDVITASYMMKLTDKEFVFDLNET